MVYINTDDVLTPANAAEELGCSRAFIYKAISEDKIVPVIISGVTFVRRADMPVMKEILKMARKGARPRKSTD